ncbi:MAG: trypsin-like peptidase domain-containing protein [Hormoscilla sp. SP12CHS1]|nr:trypsin-like peptidase domain-containing protein [Hormoscilla sp. SP12CHS1]
MNLFSKKATILIGAAVIYFQSQIAAGKMPEAAAQRSANPASHLVATGETEVMEVAKKITVHIKRYSLSPQPVFAGSGVIIARSDKTYYVLTAKHVVELEDLYEVITPDGKRHRVEYSKITKVAGTLDLAVLQFTSNSDDEYEIARLGNSDRLSPDTPVYLSGWTKSEQKYKFTSGEIMEIRKDGTEEKERQRLAREGYSLIYSNNAENGMSGGPLLNKDRCLMGTHGIRRVIQGWKNEEGNRNRYLGIPINNFVNNLPQTIKWRSLQRNSCP